MGSLGYLAGTLIERQTEYVEYEYIDYTYAFEVH